MTMGSMCIPPLHLAATTPHRSLPAVRRRRRPPSATTSSVDLSTFKLFQETPPTPPVFLELEPADPDLYGIGYYRQFSMFGVDFLEGPDGIGVYATCDVPTSRRARLIMQIPIEILLTVSCKPPWAYFPRPVPPTHPAFDIIRSTDPVLDWDLRLAILLLLAMDTRHNFWRLYSDFLPDSKSLTSLFLATDDDLAQLQDPPLAARAAEQRRRALQFWEKHWVPEAPLKVKRLAFEPERFLWAMGIVHSRAFPDQFMKVGSIRQQGNMLAPYADMLNHSFNSNCFLHWRYKDQMLEVLIKAGHEVKRGDEMTLDYLKVVQVHSSFKQWKGPNDLLMEKYGFSYDTNPWGTNIDFSGNARIHLDSFLSVFNIADVHNDYHFDKPHGNPSGLRGLNNPLSDEAAIALARILPTWSDGNVPPLPSQERRAARVLQEECRKILAGFPTSSEEDQKILDSDPQMSKTREISIKYRMHKKSLLNKFVKTLGIYQDKLLF